MDANFFLRKGAAMQASHPFYGDVFSDISCLVTFFHEHRENLKCFGHSEREFNDLCCDRETPVRHYVAAMPRDFIVMELEALGETCAEAENDPALRKRLLARILTDSKSLNAFCSAHPIAPDIRPVGQFWAVSVDMAGALRADGQTVADLFGLHIWARRSATGPLVDDPALIRAAARI
jgi:hypothetical protein